jgi:hypothetical protein
MTLVHFNWSPYPSYIFLNLWNSYTRIVLPFAYLDITSVWLIKLSSFRSPGPPRCCMRIMNMHFILWHSFIVLQTILEQVHVKEVFKWVCCTSCTCLLINGCFNYESPPCYLRFISWLACLNCLQTINARRICCNFLFSANFRVWHAGRHLIDFFCYFLMWFRFVISNIARKHKRVGSRSWKN